MRFGFFHIVKVTATGLACDNLPTLVEAYEKS
jgi:hypothetical protein